MHSFMVASGLLSYSYIGPGHGGVDFYLFILRALYFKYNKPRLYTMTSKVVVLLFSLFWPKKVQFKTNNALSVCHFYVNQLFVVDPTIYRSSTFEFVFQSKYEKEQFEK